MAPSNPEHSLFSHGAADLLPYNRGAVSVLSNREGQKAFPVVWSLLKGVSYGHNGPESITEGVGVEHCSGEPLHRFPHFLLRLTSVVPLSLVSLCEDECKHGSTWIKERQIREKTAAHSDSISPPLKCSTRSGANIFVTLHKVAVWNERLVIVYKT